MKFSKKRKITDIRGKTKNISCIACSIQKKEVDNPGSITETRYFVAEQDYEIPIPGFIVLVSRRHIQSVDELSKDEQRDFIELLCRLRATMRKALKIGHVYIIQEEDTTTSHFHIWLFPRYKWMEKKFGRKIQSVRPIMEYARKTMKTPGNLKKIDAATKKMSRCLAGTR